MCNRNVYLDKKRLRKKRCKSTSEGLKHGKCQLVKIQIIREDLNARFKSKI